MEYIQHSSWRVHLHYVTPGLPAATPIYCHIITRSEPNQLSWSLCDQKFKTSQKNSPLSIWILELWITCSLPFRRCLFFINRNCFRLLKLEIALAIPPSNEQEKIEICLLTSSRCDYFSLLFLFVHWFFKYFEFFFYCDLQLWDFKDNYSVSQLKLHFLQAVSQKDTPHNNFFFFDGVEGSGMVDRIGWKKAHTCSEPVVTSHSLKLLR